jgi:uncharacterized protein YbjT (DUF2867 family)
MILVTGGTGLIGRHVVKRLMAAGAPVRCLLSDQQQRRLPWDPAAPHAPEIVTGTVLDEEVMFGALSGVHVIIHLESAMWWGRPRDLERVELVGTRTLIGVARSARVGRIITLSHLGAAPSSAFTLLRIKGMLEDMIRASGLAYTIIRSGLVFGPEDAFINHITMMLKLNPLFFAIPGDGDVVLNPIYIDDLVDAIVLSLEQMHLVDETVEIGGPEYLTFRDMVLTVMRVSRTPRFVLPVAPYLLRGINVASALLLPRSLMTPQWLDILAASRTARLGNFYDYFGFRPRRFEDTLISYLPERSYRIPALRYTFRRRPRSL